MNNKIKTSIDSTEIATSATFYSGKILLRSEIPLNESLFQTYLQLGWFTPRSAMINTPFKKKCSRCENDKASLIGSMYCERCQKQHGYCRKCIEMGRVTECEPLYEWTGQSPEWIKYKQPCTWAGKLTKAQQLAADAIVRSISLTESELLVWAVCGAGKTEMLFPGITLALQEGKRICITTPRSDVVRELLPRLNEAFFGVPIEGLYGGSPDKQAKSQLLITTTHQLIKFSQAFDVLIIDEVDAFPYHNDPSLIRAVNKAKKHVSTTIYMTATPRKAHQTRLQQKKLTHVFVPIRFHGHPLPVPTLKLCFFLQKDLKQANLPHTFQKWLRHRHNPQRQLLIFVPTIHLANHLKDHWIPVFQRLQIITKHDQLDQVHAEDEDRQEKIEQFRNKNITVLLTTTILERGVTFPAVDVVVIGAAHEVFDEAALVQIAGRAGRSHADPHGEVLFLHDGKTDAMMNAVRVIQKMNKRGRFI